MQRIEGGVAGRPLDQVAAHCTIEFLLPVGVMYSR